MLGNQSADIISTQSTDVPDNWWGKTESVGQPENSTRRCAVPVDPRATDTAYRLNSHIIWEQAVVIRLCEVIRSAHCLTLLSPRLA